MCSIFFFFKQKRAYEMRISDWSSDVCSSDLTNVGGGRWPRCPKRCRRRTATQSRRRARAADARLQPPMKVSNSSFTFSTTMTDAITQASDASHGAITKRPIFSRSVTKRTSGITAHGRDRKSVVEGKSVSVRVDLGGRRTIQKEKTHLYRGTWP